MSANKEIHNPAEHLQIAEKMAAFAAGVKQPDGHQLTAKQTQEYLDTIGHSKNSYAEEAFSRELQELRERLEQSQKENDENLQKQQEQHDKERQEQIRENNFNRACNIIAILIAAASMVISLIK